MNLVLFEESEVSAPLPRSDPRARHILEVLRRGPGDSFDVGLVDGPRGRAIVEAIGRDAVCLAFSWGEPSLPADPIVVLAGLPRPQTARRLLRDAAGLGLQALHFFPSAKGEPSYAESSLWTTDEWRTQLAGGAAQAFDTRLPDVTAGHSLAELLEEYTESPLKLALDPYEPETALSRFVLPRPGMICAERPAILAFGAERGWSPAERQLLRESGFALTGMGRRILRMETATVAAVAVLKSRLDL